MTYDAEHALFPVWKAVVTAMAQTNARARASSEGRAYRMLEESGWEGYEGSSYPLRYYAEKLDPIVWPGAEAATPKSSSRMTVNPEPLRAVRTRGQVPAGLPPRSRETRLRTWLATGGTEANFEETP